MFYLHITHPFPCFFSKLNVMEIVTPHLRLHVALPDTRCSFFQGISGKAPAESLQLQLGTIKDHRQYWEHWEKKKKNNKKLELLNSLLNYCQKQRYLYLVNLKFSVCLDFCFCLCVCSLLLSHQNLIWIPHWGGGTQYNGYFWTETLSCYGCYISYISIVNLI